VLSSVPWAVGGEREGGGGRETEGERQREIYKEDRNTIIVTHTHTPLHQHPPILLLEKKKKRAPNT
jgi:hypothetical protein